ncbi:MAG: hypothetical protein WDA28_13020 [Castellaniella sp.]
MNLHPDISSVIDGLKNLGSTITAQKVELPSPPPVRKRGRPRKNPPAGDVESAAATIPIGDGSADKPAKSANKSADAMPPVDSTEIAGSKDDIDRRLAESSLKMISVAGANIAAECVAGHSCQLTFSEIMGGKAKCRTCGAAKNITIIRQRAETLLGVLSMINADKLAAVFESKCGKFQISVGKTADHGRAEMIGGSVTTTDASSILRIHLRTGRGFVTNMIIKAAADHNMTLPKQPAPIRRGRLPVTAEMAEAASSTAANPLAARLDMNIVYDDSICFEDRK